MEFVVAIRHRNRERARQRVAKLKLHREIRDLSNPFTDPKFQMVYRFDADTALRILAEIKPYFPASTINTAIPVEHKFLAALHFFAQGSYQKSCGKDAGLIQSQPSMSRAISQTVAALNNPAIIKKWIKYPIQRNCREQLIAKNFQRFRIPGVVGYVDGTHVYISRPKDHEELYVNRKGLHSLNVQVVCDCDLNIINVCARYPGSTHDSFVWKSSKVRRVLRAAHEESRCWVLGDSGYPTEPWLLTPILDAPEGSPEARYTRMHTSSRNCIERCFGVIKGHWQCINKRRTLNYKPEKVGRIFSACAVLHNIGMSANIGDPDVIEMENDAPVINRHMLQDADVYAAGLQARAELVQRLAAN